MIIDLLYVDYPFTKIRVSWDIYTSQNNFVDESDVLVYNCISSALNDSMDDIQYDLKMFFNSNYTHYPQKLRSLYGQILYYFSKNLQETFLQFFQNIQDEIDTANTDYAKKNKIISTIIEVVGFLLNLITFISCIYFLRKSNTSLYKSIINLFIDFTQEGNYSFKNSYDNYLMSEKLTRLKFLMTNFSVKAIDKFNKKITYEAINKNDLEENDNNLSINSKQSKQSASLKKQSEKRKKHKITKNTTVNVNAIDNKINTTNNNSLTITKSQNKLINTLSVNLISKLNQNTTPDKTNTNTSTKNGLTADSSSQNIIKTNNKKKEIEEENILTKEMIFEKLNIFEVNTVKFFNYACIILPLILLVYMIVKLLQTYSNFSNAQTLFDDYSIVTFEYCMIMNYFNNFNLLLINQPMGRESYMRGMQARVEGQFKKSEEVKKKSIKKYPKVSQLFDSLNNADKPEEIRETLCGDYDVCLIVFDSEYNIVKKGVDIGIKSIAQQIYGMLDDYFVIKNQLTNTTIIKDYFITKEFLQIDMSLNFLLYMVEEKCAKVFLIEADDLIKDFKTIIISLNIFIIIFLSIISILLIFLIINRITRLLNLIEKSSLRISISINQLKEKYFGAKGKSGSIL